MLLSGVLDVAIDQNPRQEAADILRLLSSHLDGAPRFDYEPTYVLRALKSLHLEFDPL